MIGEFVRSADAAPPDPEPIHLLTTQQRRTLEVVLAYYQATGEACPGSIISRRMNINRSTVMKHVAALHRKGWLRSASAPAHPAILE
jgi:hypothetical protein